VQQLAVGFNQVLLPLLLLLLHTCLVCRLFMWADRDNGTVTFKLREPHC
jgi:hypothetical protein